MTLWAWKGFRKLQVDGRGTGASASSTSMRPTCLLVPAPLVDRADTRLGAEKVRPSQVEVLPRRPLAPAVEVDQALEDRRRPAP